MSNIPTVVSVINLKGGVGKTTVTALLARYAAAEWGLDTLAVDLDPQANLSQALMTEQGYTQFMDAKQPSIVELFDGFAPATENKPSPTPLEPADVIKQVFAALSEGKGKLEIIPSRFDFSDQLVRSTRVNEKVLAQFIASHMQHKNLILIDCAPTESILTIASYHASRYILIPVKLEFFSTIGFPLMKQSLDDFRNRNRGHKIDVCGALIRDTKTSGQPLSVDADDSLGDIRAKAGKYEWPIFDNWMHHSDGYPKLMKDPYPNWPGNAVSEWTEVAEEILAKISSLRKQERTP